MLRSFLRAIFPGNSANPERDRLKLEVECLHARRTREDRKHREEIRRELVIWERTGGRAAWDAWVEKLRTDRGLRVA